jgi:hypothetical protein
MAIKTLHITNSYHPASGGIRTFYHALLDGANRHRRLVRLVVPGPETRVPARTSVTDRGGFKVIGITLSSLHGGWIFAGSPGGTLPARISPLRHDPLRLRLRFASQ